MLLKDYILCAMNDPDCSFAHTEIDVSGADSSEIIALLEKAGRLLAHSDREDDFWNTILLYVPESMLTDELLGYLISSRIALTALGHKQLGEKWLKKLSRDVPEAALTLADEYSSDRCSPEQFRDFLEENSANADVLLYVLSVCRLDETKRKLAYYDICRCGEPAAAETARQCTYAWVLSITDRVQDIRDAMETGNPLYLAAIASNLHTPDELLERLSQIKGVKNSSVIRQASRQTRKWKAGKRRAQG